MQVKTLDLNDAYEILCEDGTWRRVSFAAVDIGGHSFVRLRNCDVVIDCRADSIWTARYFNYCEKCGIGIGDECKQCENDLTVLERSKRDPLGR